MVFPRVLLLVLSLLTFISSHVPNLYPDISFHTYANDLQLYLNCTDTYYASNTYTNGLIPTPLNLTPPKPKISFSTNPYVPPPYLNHPILLNLTTLPYFKYIRNLSLHIDSTLSLDTRIAHMHKSIHYHCFRLIRRSIPFPIAVTIASFYILPLFDYCNNILFNLPAYKLIKLKRQNALVCRFSDSITPLLKQLLAHKSHTVLNTNFP